MFFLICLAVIATIDWSIHYQDLRHAELAEAPAQMVLVEAAVGKEGFLRCWLFVAVGVFCVVLFFLY